MFLTSSPASMLSDDIGNRGPFHKTNDYLLIGSLASTVSDLRFVHVCLLGVHVTAIAHGAHSILLLVYRRPSPSTKEIQHLKV